MTNRRDIIKGAIAAAAIPAMPAVPAFAGARRVSPFYKVIYDARFPVAASFAAEAKRRGADVRAISGNITPLWYGDLYHRWKSSPSAIAGLTTYRSMFGLEMMAQDVGMRVVYQANHLPLGHGAFAHARFGPSAFLARLQPLRGAVWPRITAASMMGWSNSMVRTHTDIAAARARAIGPDVLLSWIIAPVQRA